MTLAKTTNPRFSTAYRKASLEKRFHKSYIEQAGPLKDKCWIWIGGVNNTGWEQFRYGILRANKKQLLAHRVSWELHNKQTIPEGMFVCHRCDVPKCVNPEHLYIGTAANNMEDRDVRGRKAVGKCHGQYVHGKYVNQARWRTRPNGTRYYYSGNDSKQ